MLIQELPDDCMVILFEYFDLIDDLVNMSRVCCYWDNLVKRRLFKTKYLMRYMYSSSLFKSYASGKDTILMKEPDIVKELDLSELLPNLEVLDLEIFKSSLLFSEFMQIMDKNPNIKGLIEPPNCPDSIVPRTLENVRMLVFPYGHRFKGIYHPQNLTQLVLYDCEISKFHEYTEYFRNLSRLGLTCNPNDNALYDGPALFKLKILSFDVDFNHGTNEYPGYHFMDYCPNLKSAYFKTATDNFYIDETIKNPNLRDLVIEHKFHTNQDWPSLRRLLSKFPNLRHLAIRKNDEIDDDNVKDLLELLPKIELMDLRTCYNVTKRSAELAKRLGQRVGRPIQVYFHCYGAPHKEPHDWHRLEHSFTPVCSRFNFMRNCFFVTDYYLP